MSTQGNGAESGGNGHAPPSNAPQLQNLRVVVDPDPAIAGARLAEELDGELIFEIDAARRAFAARTGRTDTLLASAGEFDRLLAEADELEGLGGGPAVDEAALAELRELADAISRTDRIRTRTEVEFTESLNRKLSASSGMAVHPETIKQAALGLTAAEGEVSDIDRAIDQLGDRPRPEQVQLDEPVVEMFDDDGLEQQRRARVFALSVGTIFAGVALVLLNFDVPIVIPVVVFLVGVVIAGVMMARSYSIEIVDPGAREASALLAAATGNATRTTEAAARGREAEEEWLARRSQLEAARERSLEKARSARRHWETLAGPDADPYDLDAVLRVHDPQFVITGAATQTSPTVRTVNAVHRKAMARWKVAWAALGYESPPEIGDVDEHLARLSSKPPSSQAPTPSASRGGEVDVALPSRPMILVEPENWLPEDELESMLVELPRGSEVILVTRA